MPQRPCLDCDTLTTGRRCPPCATARQRQRDQQRGTTTQRGLGWQHQQAARHILNGADTCAICGKPPTPTDPLTAGHITPRAHGGSSDPSNYQPEHRSCNSAKGAR